MEARRLPALPITSFSVCSALGRDTHGTLSALFEERSGLVAPPMPLPFDTRVGAVDADLPPLDPSFAVHESRVARIAEQLYAELEPAVRAAVAKWGRHRVAIVLGTSTGGLAETERAVMHHTATGALPAGFDLERTHSMSCAADYLRVRAGVDGPTYSLSTACSSSGKVFASAQRLIAAGLVDAAIVGGIDSLCQTTLQGFHSLGILSQSACKPFSAERAGLSIGDGDAHARLLGVGESADGYHMSSPHPEGLGARLAMTQALDMAGLNVNQIDYINAHGTGTPKNDFVECLAIEALFGDRTPVSSTKALTGHTLGAAGAIEAAIAIACLSRGWIPSSVGADPVDPKIRVQLVARAQSTPVRAVLSNSLGFGGSNVALVLGGA